MDPCLPHGFPPLQPNMALPLSTNPPATTQCCSLHPAGCHWRWALSNVLGRPGGLCWVAGPNPALYEALLSPPSGANPPQVTRRLPWSPAPAGRIQQAAPGACAMQQGPILLSMEPSPFLHPHPQLGRPQLGGWDWVGGLPHTPPHQWHAALGIWEGITTPTAGQTWAWGDPRLARGNPREAWGSPACEQRPCLGLAGDGSLFVRLWCASQLIGDGSAGQQAGRHASSLLLFDPGQCRPLPTFPSWKVNVCYVRKLHRLNWFHPGLLDCLCLALESQDLSNNTVPSLENGIHRRACTLNGCLSNSLLSAWCKPHASH